MLGAEINRIKAKLSSSARQLFPILVDTFANITSIKEKAQEVAQKLNKYPLNPFKESSKPKVCSLIGPSSFFVAQSRVDTMQQLFNFMYNSGRVQLYKEINTCCKPKDTKEALREIFAVESADTIQPYQSQFYCKESDGFVTIILERKENENIQKSSIALIKTEFVAGNDAADENDIVPFDGIVVFQENEKYGGVIIGIKIDDIPEQDEYFQIAIGKFTRKQQRTWILFELACIVQEDLYEEVNQPDVAQIFSHIKNGALLIAPSSGIACGALKFTEGTEPPGIIFGNSFELVGPGTSKQQFTYLHEDKGHKMILIENKEHRKMFVTTYKDISHRHQTQREVFLDPINAHQIAQATFHVNYLPWMIDSITFMKLENSQRLAFTAMLSGCGVFLFKIKNTKTNLYDHFMCHQNAKTTKLACPTEDLFTNLLWVKYSMYFNVI